MKEHICSICKEEIKDIEHMFRINLSKYSKDLPEENTFIVHMYYKVCPQCFAKIRQEINKLTI